MDRNRSELKQELKTNQVEFQCEPGVCACGPVFVSNPNLIQYQSVDDCVNDNNCCKRWKCDPNSLGACEAVDDINAPFDTEQDCLALHPTGCGPTGPEICCDVWVCVNGGKFNKCCKQVNLCKPPNAPFDTNYPGGFPWNLVESSGVPPKEFNRVLKENLLLEWTCNMSWSAHFGIWLGATKAECMAGPSWTGVGPASGQGGCGPCNKQADMDKSVKFSDDENMKIKTNDTLKGKDAEEYIKNMRDSGRIERLDESFYSDIVSLVEDIYHTKNLLKG